MRVVPLVLAAILSIGCEPMGIQRNPEADPETLEFYKVHFVAGIDMYEFEMKSGNGTCIVLWSDFNGVMGFSCVPACPGGKAERE